MKKITLIFAAAVMSYGAWAQGNGEASKLLSYERYTSAKNALATATAVEDKYNLGLAEIGLGNIDAAAQIFNSLGDNEYSQAGLARIAYLKGDYNKGNGILDDLTGRVKRKEYHIYKLAADAITYTKGGNIDKAIEWYLKSLERNKEAATYVALGDAYLLKNDAINNGNALTAFEDAVKLDPRNSLSNSRQGLLLYQAAMYQEALAKYTKASELDPKNPLPYRDLANAYYKTSSYNLAKTNIEKYFSLSDASEEDVYQYTNILYLTKDYPGVIAKVNELTTKTTNPKPYLYRIKAFSQYETEDYAGAQTSLDQFFKKVGPNDKVIFEDYYYAGKILLKQAEAEEDEAKKEALFASAEKAFEKGLTINDKAEELDNVKSIAVQFENAKDNARTAKWFGKVMEMSKGTASSLDYFNYGYSLYYTMDFQKCFETFEKMGKLFPNSQEDQYFAEFWMGMSGSQLDDEAKTGKALPHFTKWLDMKLPEGKTRTESQLRYAYQYLAYYYMNKKDKTNALKYANLIKTVNPENEFADQVISSFK